MNSKVHTLRLSQYYENMLTYLTQYYRNEMSSTGLNMDVTESSVIKTAIEREYNRVRKAQEKETKKKA